MEISTKQQVIMTIEYLYERAYMKRLSKASGQEAYSLAKELTGSIKWHLRWQHTGSCLVKYKILKSWIVVSIRFHI